MEEISTMTKNWFRRVLNRGITSETRVERDFHAPKTYTIMQDEPNVDLARQQNLFFVLPPTHRVTEVRHRAVQQHILY
jgi:hypothetical protein